MESARTPSIQDMADLIIRNGRVIDPANQLDQISDVALKNGKILTVGKQLELAAAEEFDASGCLVTPGLIDVHTHVYQYATPLGVDVDRCCLARGVTTVVDAGSSGNSLSSWLAIGEESGIHRLGQGNIIVLE